MNNYARLLYSAKSARVDRTRAGENKSPGLRQSPGHRPNQSRDRASCEAPERESFFSQQTADHFTNELAHFFTPLAIGDQSDHHDDQNHNQFQQERNPQRG